jgi:hypothetical protein
MPPKPRTPSKARRKMQNSPVERLMDRALANHPDVALVREISLRARDLEAIEPPRSIGIATDIVAMPTNSQYPV